MNIYVYDRDVSLSRCRLYVETIVNNGFLWFQILKSKFLVIYSFFMSLSFVDFVLSVFIRWYPRIWNVALPNHFSIWKRSRKEILTCRRITRRTKILSCYESLTLILSGTMLYRRDIQILSNYFCVFHRHSLSLINEILLFWDSSWSSSTDLFIELFFVPCHFATLSPLILFFFLESNSLYSSISSSLSL